MKFRDEEMQELYLFALAFDRVCMVNLYSPEWSEQKEKELNDEFSKRESAFIAYVESKLAK